MSPSAMADALSGDDREARTQAVIGIGGTAACGVMAWSLLTLRDTGCGLPPGPLGLVGAAEGVSYLYVLALVAWSAAKKVRTGSGLPEGPGGVLGLAEGLAYLLALAGVAVLVGQVEDFGFLPNAVPVEGGRASRRDGRVSFFSSLSFITRSGGRASPPAHPRRHPPAHFSFARSVSVSPRWILDGSSTDPRWIVVAAAPHAAAPDPLPGPSSASAFWSAWSAASCALA